MEYLVPVKSGEAFVVGFDPDRLEEVATLADRIEKQKETIAEIESDIESFMSVVDHPTIGTLMSRVRQLANQLQSAVTEARNVAQAQAALHPDLLPTQVAVLPDVVATAERCVQVKEETEAQIRELKARIAEATKIFSKYIA